MLKKINGNEDDSGAAVEISKANFPSPFYSGLEYAAPARGTWNIVHTGFLLPEAHEIFVCAEGCLRGVVLTAAEMGASERFSTISICENNILDGDMEDLIVDGVADILNKLPYKPKAVLVYTSCVHHFIGCDLPLVYKRLKEKYKDIDFADCYMNPIMRRSGLTPDMLMRSRLYSLLKEHPQNKKSINIIGNDFATDKNSELVKIIKKNGFSLQEIQSCKTYSDYQKMAESSLNITYQAAANPGANELQKRLNQKHLYLPLSFDYQKITDNYNLLCDELKIDRCDFKFEIESCEKALNNLKLKIGDTPVAIDYTATFKPLELALLLIKHGINVERIYVDSFSDEEKSAFAELQKISPDLKIIATVNVKMRFLQRKTDSKYLAVGQKAAYFTGSNNFVNIVECGGYYGFSGIIEICNLMLDAFEYEKDAKSLISVKGLGCGCSL